LKVVPVRAASARTWIETPPVSWLGGEAWSLGPIRLRHVVCDVPEYRRPSHPVAEGQWLAPNNSALQSRGGDGFSPSSRARSLGWLWTAVLAAACEARDASFVGLLVEVCRAYGAW